MSPEYAMSLIHSQLCGGQPSVDAASCRVAFARRRTVNQLESGKMPLLRRYLRYDSPPAEGCRKPQIVLQLPRKRGASRYPIALWNSLAPGADTSSARTEFADDVILQFNYYATQAVFDWEGEGSWIAWDKWLRGLRQQLVATQIKEGNEAGSWAPGKGKSLADDRFCRTVLNALALQVYANRMTRYFHFR